jgi:cytoskeleton protein RodZ
MGSFGDRLKKEREQRGVTLEDISLNTKIGTRLLRALEDEKFDQLPGGIFNKGFVRAYARHLGLDENETLADYLTALDSSQGIPAHNTTPLQFPTPRPDASEVEHSAEKQEDAERREIPWGLLAVLLLVVALAFASWSYFHRSSQINRGGGGPASTPERSALSSSVLDEAARDGSAARPLPADEGRNTPPTAPIPTTEQNKATVSQVAQAALHGAAPPAPAAAGTFTVVLKGNDESENCWVSVVVDGQAPTEAILQGPYEKVLQGKTEIVVKAGSIGALDVFFNGKKLPSLGNYGEVRTLTFHSDGLQPAAAKAVVPDAR